MNNEYLKLVQEAREKKNKLDKEATKEIKTVFQEASEELKARAERAKSGSLTERFLLEYKRSVDETLGDINKQLNDITKKAMNMSAGAANDIQLSFFDIIDQKYGLGISDTFKTAFANVPNVVQEILSGKMYRDNMGLSKRIWMDTSMMGKDMAFMLEKAIVSKKSAFDFAKDIEQYVNPEARKDWDWSKVYPGARKQIDYNAQRLARTSINHAYWLSNTRSSSKNPFVNAMHWELSNSHFQRQVLPFGEDICDEFARQDWYGLGVGNFPADEVPIPHPQCLCVQYAVVNKSMEEIGSELRAWVDGEKNPMLDEWYDVNVRNPEKEESQRPDLRSATWMARQPKELKEYYLGGKNKRILFEAGLLQEKDFGKNLHKLQEDGIMLIKRSRVEHSVLGDFGKESGRMISGGHGQQNIEELTKRGIGYNISHTYSNGVRTGTVVNHKKRWNREDNGQSWFPKDWDADKIQAAGTYVANKGSGDGTTHKYGIYKNVKMGIIIQPDGQVGTIFPDVAQSHLREGD